jgi:hypothetical protein
VDHNQLIEAVAELGLDPDRVVSWQDAAQKGQASPEVGYNIIVGAKGTRVLSATGRGSLAEAPYPGYSFTDEAQACEYVWRVVRSRAAPELLTATERETNRRLAEETIAHRSTRSKKVR